MSLLYGEGDRAFLHFQEEIIKISDDNSIFAWDRALSGAGTVSCLASHPSWFERGAYVVPFGIKQSRSTSYTITNHGVRMTLPRYVKPVSNIVYGLIDCHWANTLTGCIGILLLGTMGSLFLERSPRHPPEEILCRDMESAETRKQVFLNTRPVVDFTFAAEVTLQLYDRMLQCGFTDTAVVDNPMHTYSWNGQYKSFALRWPSTGELSRYETINLLWRDEDRPGLCLSVRIGGRLKDRLNDGVGHFEALKVEAPTEIHRLMSRYNIMHTECVECHVGKDCLESKCRIKLADTSVEIVADIFGNEISILEITELP